MHNLVWFALLIAVCWRAYKLLLDPPLGAALASVMFALDAAHGATVGWISNRNALIGATLAIAALLFHHWGASSRSRTQLAAAAILFSLGLLASELALGAFGYLIAYEVCLSRQPLRARGARLAPYAMLLVAWGFVRKLGGYGAFAIYTYVDPLREPAKFLRTLPERSLLLIASQSLRLVSDLKTSLPVEARPVYLLVAFVGCGLVLWFAWPSLRRSASARFFGLGALLSAVPIAATLPADRLMTLLGFGVLGLLAHAIATAIEQVRLEQDRAFEPRPRCASALCALHLVVAPLCLPLTALLPAMTDRALQTVEQSFPDDQPLRDKTLIVTAVPESFSMSYLPVMRSEHQKQGPSKQYWLASTHHDVHLERRATNVLRVSPERGFYDNTSEARAREAPLHVGDRIELRDMTVVVVSLTSDGRPAVCDFVFREALESNHYVWVTWHDGHLAPWPVIAVGDSTVVSLS